jgi:hypothetical protein
VFIRVKAPHRGMTNTGVTQVVNAAAHRAGLGTIHARFDIEHTFRLFKRCSRSHRRPGWQRLSASVRIA